MGPGERVRYCKGIDALLVAMATNNSDNKSQVELSRRTPTKSGL